jgi:hypothetical protein
MSRAALLKRCRKIYSNARQGNKAASCSNPAHFTTMPNAMVNLFTYGSLMCSDIMFKVAGCQLEFNQAVLNNFFRSKMHGREYPGIVQQPKAQVSGVFYYNFFFEAL